MRSWRLGLVALPEEEERVSVSHQCNSKEQLCKDIEGGCVEARKSALTEPDKTGTLIRNFHSPELWENKFLLFKPLV